MMDAGRSFSGNERNCFFINLGNGKFADISGLSGLDFPDDGRAISVTDWDNDGDLDLWITNRNAPRLRLMRNDTKEDNPFISILLKGNGETVNKDAIGARIEIINGKNSGKFKQIQTLRAGQGFLSQSSKWIQFALNETIKSIDIKISWPDGTVSKIEDVLPNKKYIIRQENPTAEEVKLESKKNNLVSSPGLKNPPSQVARIPAITLFKGPTINLRKNGIANQKNNKKSHQLINLWATWCAPCLQEMAHFRDHKKTLIDNKVELIAVNIDELDAQNDNSKKPSDVIKKMNFPFPSISANKQLMEILQRIHDQSVGLNEPLPIPSSFLIDPNGDVSVIYKGPVNVEQIIKDLRLSSEGFITRFKAAAKLEGSIIKNPRATRRLFEHEASIHRRHAINWYNAGDLRGAINHFEKANKLTPDSKELSSQLASVYFAFATQMDRQEMKGVAIDHYRKGLVIDPSNNAARNNLAWILATSASQDLRNAEEALIVATKLNTDTGNKVPQVLDTLAAAQAANGQFTKAAKSAEIAISQLKNAPKLKQNIQNRLNLYKKGKAFLQSTKKE
ncbi:MAG: ASPIC/UnbV domain-containing protein [Verrucomicrobiales bacterium]|nr:ASPIC/UnbV domain-containing protein [Verrucomicrobiales bacterium]